MTQPTQKASAKVRLPVPGIASTGVRSTPPQPTDVTATDMPATRYCADPNHRTTADCVREMTARKSPVNGTQKCALVAARNAVLSFRQLMRWDDPSFTSATPPPEHVTAREIWAQFERLMNGCVDHICEHSTRSQLLDVLGAYADFADPLRASLALALRWRLSNQIKFSAEDEYERQLRRQLADDPVLKYVFEHATREHK